MGSVPCIPECLSNSPLPYFYHSLFHFLTHDLGTQNSTVPPLGSLSFRQAIRFNWIFHPSSGYRTLCIFYFIMFHCGRDQLGPHLTCFPFILGTEPELVSQLSPAVRCSHGLTFGQWNMSSLPHKTFPGSVIQIFLSSAGLTEQQGSLGSNTLKQAEPWGAWAGLKELIVIQERSFWIWPLMKINFNHDAKAIIYLELFI